MLKLEKTRVAQLEKHIKNMAAQVMLLRSRSSSFAPFFSRLEGSLWYSKVARFSFFFLSTRCTW